MKSSEYKLLAIRKNHRISDYLASKGHEPIRDLGDKLMYICPIHEDNAPSFVVFLESAEKEYEEYYCFGCKSNYCIISLYSALEKVDWRTAVLRLGADVDVTQEDEAEYIINHIKEEQSKKHILPDDAIGDMLLEIAHMCDMYKRKVDNDPSEIAMIRSLSKYLFNCFVKEDIESISKVYEMLLHGVMVNGERVNLFLHRYDQWKSKKDADLKDSLIAYGNI